MNDLMTKSFLSYVELKKQARKDEQDGNDFDLETVSTNKEEEQEDPKLSQFFQDVSSLKSEMEEISNLLIDLQALNLESKSTHSAKLLRGIRDRMESNMASILRKAKTVRSTLESLDRTAHKTRKTHVDRTKISVTNGLRVKLREMMNDFQALRDKIVSDHKEDLKRRYFVKTGEQASEEVIEKMMLGGGGDKVAVFIEEEGKTEDVEMGNRVRHEAVIDIQRSLNKLHQVFIDMAVLVETQGEKMDDIEENVVNAASYVSGGTTSLFYANQMKKKSRKWVCWVLGVLFIIFVVCLIAMLSS